MKVTDKLSMPNYDKYCAAKAPNWRSRDYRRRIGDCMYDFSAGAVPKLRRAVHDERNRKKALSGKYALISKHFHYFGDQPVKLPPDLLPIMHPTHGHKSHSNEPYVGAFEEWIEDLGYLPNRLYGQPQLMAEYSRDSDIQVKCSVRALEEDE